MRQPASPKLNRRPTIIATNDSLGGPSTTVRTSSMKYQSQRTASGASLSELLERTVANNNLAASHNSDDVLKNTIDRKDLSAAEESNLLRLFLTFATEYEEETDDGTTAHGLSGKVLEFAELKALLKCLGLKFTDEMFDKMVKDLNPRIHGELQFNEFVTLMVRSQDLRELREQLEAEEKSHIENSSGSRFQSDSTWRWVWDVVILCITGYFLMLVSYEWVVPNPMTAGWWTIESIFAVILIADIVVYAHTDTKDSSGRAVEKFPDVMKLYAKRTLVFDVLGSLPIDLIISFVFMKNHHEQLVWFVFRAFKLLRFVRVVFTLFSGVSIHGFLRPRFVYLQYTLSPVFKALFYFITIVHFLSIGWMIVKLNTETEEVNYIDAIYIVLYTLSTVGYGDMEIAPGAQRVYCCFLFLGGVVMNGLVISQMSVFLQKADIQNERKDKMRETLAVLSHFDIPQETQSEILSFQHHLLSHNLGKSHEELMGNLPETIQESLGLFMRIKFIAMVPMFAQSPHDCQAALATTLVNIVFHPHEFIIVAGEIGREMYFLGHGAADVIGPEGQHFATMRKGMFFGEIALLVDGALRNASIKALTYCDTFRLEKGDFTRIMLKFPQFREILETEMAERIEKFKASQKAQPEKRTRQRRKRSSQMLVVEDPMHDSHASAPDMPSFEDMGPMETSINVRRGANNALDRSGIGLGRRPGRSTTDGSESPRFGGGGGHRPPRVGFSNFNHLAGGGGEHRRTSGIRGANTSGTSFPDAEAFALLAERVAMLERRASTTQQQTPLIPPAYREQPRTSNNAGKSKTEYYPPVNVPGSLAEMVSSDEETSGQHSPHAHRGLIAEQNAMALDSARRTPDELTSGGNTGR